MKASKVQNVPPMHSTSNPRGMATQNSLPPFFSPFFPLFSTNNCFHQVSWINYEGDIIFQGRGRKVGIKVTDIAAG